MIKILKYLNSKTVNNNIQFQIKPNICDMSEEKLDYLYKKYHDNLITS